MATPSIPPDYYEILKVSTDASPEEIEKQYQKLVAELDPKHFPQGGAHMEGARAKLQKVKKAYEALSHKSIPSPVEGEVTEIGDNSDEFPSTWPDHSDYSKGPSGNPPLSYLSAREEYNSVRDFSGYPKESMEQLAHKFISQFKLNPIPVRGYWCPTLERNASQFAFDLYKGPVEGTDCYVRVRVIFKKRGPQVLAQLNHQVVLYCGFWARVWRLFLRVVLMVALIWSSVAVASYPLAPLTKGLLLLALFMVHQVVEQMVNGHRFSGRMVTWIFDAMEKEPIAVYLPAFTYVGCTFFALKGPMEIFYIGIAVTALTTLLHIVFTGIGLRDIGRNKKILFYDNTAIRDEVYYAMAATLDGRIERRKD